MRKMFKTFCIILLCAAAVVLLGKVTRQRAQAIPPTVAVPDGACLALADAVDSLRLRAMTLDSALSNQRVRASVAEQSMRRFVAIVRRDPSQAKFLGGWTNRAFQGMLP